MYVAGVLYRKCDPGLNGTGWARKVFVQAWSLLADGSSPWCPVDIRSRSLTRIALRFLLGSLGASSGKNFRTGSLEAELPLGDRQADGGRGEALAQ